MKAARKRRERRTLTKAELLAALEPPPEPPPTCLPTLPFGSATVNGNGAAASTDVDWVTDAGGQTLSLPDPATLADGTVVTVQNNGTDTGTLNGAAIIPSQRVILQSTGTAWSQLWSN